MKCECCGRETEVLIEIGAIRPQASVSGRCCASCCAFMLRALEEEREVLPERRAEIIPVDEKQLFVDCNGEKVNGDVIRFGMKDYGGRVHYFQIYKVEQFPEYEAYEIYPAGKKPDSDRTCYSFRSFGYRKSDEILVAEVLEMLETALLNPVIREEVSSTPFPGKRQYLGERGHAEISWRADTGETGFIVDGKRFSAQEFADMLSCYEGFRMNWQIQDVLTEVPDRDTYWLPVRITDELLLEELEQLIWSASGNREFISYKNMNAFDFGFGALYEKLKLYVSCNLPGVGKLAGMKLIHRLEELETDDELFPEYQVGVIRDLIGEF